ncbi:MAG: hypothetical protein J6P98_01290, partial [Clostridia bacterium]|nr:hypothetical protein [Clostridia bacterium]
MNRVYIKARAKSNFRGYYWVLVGIFALALILGAVTGNSPSLSFNLSSDLDLTDLTDIIGQDGRIDLSGITDKIRDALDTQALQEAWDNISYAAASQEDVKTAITIGVAAVGGIMLIAVIIGFVYAIFIAGPVGVGASRVGIGVYDGEVPVFRDLFWAFRSGKYMRIVGVSALVGLFELLPLIVCMVIGGILTVVSKSVIPFAVCTVLSIIVMWPIGLGLSQVNKLLADPHRDGAEESAMDVVRLSWDMMRGHKW